MNMNRDEWRSSPGPIIKPSWSETESVVGKKDELNKYEGKGKKSNNYGQGIDTWAGKYEGQKYDGQWESDKQHGKGVMIYANGHKYEGQWKNGKRRGRCSPWQLVGC